MKKILILGKDGMAGHVLMTYLSSLGKYEVIGTTNKKPTEKNDAFFDAERPNEILAIVQAVKPDVIINCIGMLVKASEENPEKAKVINTQLPQLLAKYSQTHNFKLIHLSTDCIFSGKKGNYSESDSADAETTYGKTKAAGEIRDDHNLTIRMSIIGPEIKENGTGLFHWFFKQKQKIEGYANVLWTGITTLQLAKSIEQLLEKNATGLIQLVPDTKISKYDLLKMTNEIFGKKIEISKNTDKKDDKSLKSTKIAGIYVPDYKTMLLELKEWMIKHKNIYNKHIYQFL
jgi:dTDP-4-dehydrorhamnose reductase